MLLLHKQAQVFPPSVIRRQCLISSSRSPVSSRRHYSQKQMFWFRAPKRFRFRRTSSILNGHINVPHISRGIHVHVCRLPCLNIQYHLVITFCCYSGFVFFALCLIYTAKEKNSFLKTEGLIFESLVLPDRFTTG